MAFGTYGYGVSSFRLRNDLLLELPELSYIAINVRGCRAYVQVRERVEAPEIIEQAPAGEHRGGQGRPGHRHPALGRGEDGAAGDHGAEGQLLISGVVDDDYAGSRYLRGMGKVYGRTWYTLRCRVPLTVAEKAYTGEEETVSGRSGGKKADKLLYWQ